MKRSLISMSLLALCAGCAGTHFSSPTAVTAPQTTMMAAGAATVTVCQDGALMQADSACALHGGVDRQSTYAGYFPRY